MIIKKMHLKNFKSIDNLDIDFEHFTLMVGANATGKSNIINSFKFISDILNKGIEDAVCLQGGIEYLSNAKSEKGLPIEVGFELVIEKNWRRAFRNNNISLKINNLNYKFIIQPNKRGSGYKIIHDEMSIIYKIYRFDAKEKAVDDKSQYLDTDIKIDFLRKNKEKKVTVNTSVIGNTENIENIKELAYRLGAYVFADIMSMEQKELMLFRASIMLPPMFSDNTFIKIYDFDPKQLKKACSMTSIKSLSEDGANIAVVLKEILRVKTKRDALTKLLSNILPFIESLSVENNLDQSYAYKIKESYTNKSFYANYLSDGTVSIIALILALYFENRSNIIILEEPERNIHPALLQKIIEMVKDVSNDKQIIITTHNPEIVKHTLPENIRFIKRDIEGYTRVYNPSNSEMVRCFLKNDLGLDDLFMHNMLG